jgi:hypothetical protein
MIFEKSSLRPLTVDTFACILCFMDSAVVVSDRVATNRYGETIRVVVLKERGSWYVQQSCYSERFSTKKAALREADVSLEHWEAVGA